jgi:hypothetical protein
VAATLASRGRPATRALVDHTGVVANVDGLALSLAEALPVLAALPADDIDAVPPSLAAWSLATKLALDLVARERVTPLVASTAAGAAARWGVSLVLPDDADRVRRLAQAFPRAAHVAVAGGQGGARDAEDVLIDFLDAVADLLARGGEGVPPPVRLPSDGTGGRRDPWERRLVTALTDPAASDVFLPAGVLERGLIEELTRWAAPARGSLATRAPRLCLKLDLPPESAPGRGGGHASDARSWRLGFFLQAPDDPSLLLPAADVWSARGERLEWMDRAFAEPQELLLRELARAARSFPPIEESLETARPEAATLDTDAAWRFLSEAAPVLAEAGFGVILPVELTSSGQRRLRLRMRMGDAEVRAAGAVATGRGFSLDTVLQYRWEAALAGEAISSEEFDRLVGLKRPLVRWRGQWVVVDPGEAAEVRRLLLDGGGRLTGREALAAALGGTLPQEGHRPPVEIVAEGPLGALLDRLRQGPIEVPVPRDLEGELRPYQQRGLGWLGSMAALGLGGCLADDMGLGKTVQTIAFLLARRQAHRRDRRPALIVCPMSVVGNWERELARFAPTLPVVRHHGAGRARTLDELTAAPPHAIVVTTYGMLRRDRALLGEMDWAVAVLDEAQNVKNPASQQAGAARALRASHRFALTGTPLENRLAELWSILEYCVPGILGPLEGFRRRFAVPIERYRDEAAAERLRRLVSPFLLRRLKSDPAIAADLPPKQEMPVVCTLTREQATLYQAAVEDAMARIEGTEGVKRRGIVLALLTALKQICNHPAHYLHEAGPLPGRSGKLMRLTEMLEETVAAGDRALVFTQYRQMGDLLVAHLQSTLGAEVLFLHGGVPRDARDAMVRRFQDDPRAPAIFVLSLRAGGTGLNLTRASRVLHFDRWWNPAVEDQATDRAHRIGQQQLVQVYRLLAAGTLEEKIDAMLTDKRALADRVVGAGETWITELPDSELRRLVALSSDATIEEEGD